MPSTTTNSSSSPAGSVLEEFLESTRIIEGRTSPFCTALLHVQTCSLLLNFQRSCIEASRQLNPFRAVKMHRGLPEPRLPSLENENKSTRCESGSVPPAPSCYSIQRSDPPLSWTELLQYFWTAVLQASDFSWSPSEVAPKRRVSHACRLRHVALRKHTRGRGQKAVAMVEEPSKRPIPKTRKASVASKTIEESKGA